MKEVKIMSVEKDETRWPEKTPTQKFCQVENGCPTSIERTTWSVSFFYIYLVNVLNRYIVPPNLYLFNGKRKEIQVGEGFRYGIHSIDVRIPFWTNEIFAFYRFFRNGRPRL